MKNQSKIEMENKISGLTIEEKLKLLTGYDGMNAVYSEREGKARIRMADGPFGVKTKQGESVCFPNTCLMASSFDRDLCYEIGKMIGGECKRLDINLLLAPAVNIKRSPLAGRNFEYYSEDPYLTGSLALEYIKGIHTENIGVCVKHFACNNQESMRWVQNSAVDLDTLHNIYLKAFEMLVEAGEVDAIMTSYNRVNGVPVAEDEYLVSKILREDWKYDGLIISDWASVDNLVKAIKTGMDLEMPSNLLLSLPELQKAVTNGELTEEEIDEHLKRLFHFAQKHEIEPKKTLETDQQRLRKLTGECFVLLKNENILPLSTNEKILLVGTAVKTPRVQGGGCAMIQKAKGLLSPLEEITKKNPHSEYVENYNLETLDKEKLKAYDKIIVFLSLGEDCDSEAVDRKDISFPQEQLDCIETLAKYNENIIAVMTNGSAMDVRFSKCVKGLLEVYYAGSTYGGAVCDVLFGENVPCGKIAETFPCKMSDLPVLEDFGGRNNVAYREKEFVGYRYFTTYNVKTAYPFGFGLSYCNFEWTNIQIETKEDYAFSITLELKNCSKYDGKEIVQVYLKAECAFEPKMRLLEFCAVRLKAGEKKQVTLQLTKKNFETYIGAKKVLFEGKYSICIARSSEDIVLEKSVMLIRTDCTGFDENTLLGELLQDEKLREVTLKYVGKAINLWAYDEEVTEKKFEENKFLKSHVYDMPIRGIAYFSKGELNEKQIKAFLNELTECKKEHGSKNK